jgi:hypothetical protein
MHENHAVTAQALQNKTLAAEETGPYPPLKGNIQLGA